MPLLSVGRKSSLRATDRSAMTRLSSGKHPDPAPRGAGIPPSSGIPAWIADTLICLALGGMGLWFVVNAWALPGGRGLIGVGTFPKVMGILLILFCTAQIILSASSRRGGKRTSVDRPLMVAMGTVLILLFPVAMDRFGYYLTAALWVPAFAWIAGMREAVTFVVITAVLLGMARFVFEGLLGTPLS